MDDPLTLEQIGTLSAIAMGVGVAALIASIIAILLACKSIFIHNDNNKLPEE